MEIVDLLKDTALFRNLQPNELDLIARSTRLETFPTGKAIIREGRVGAAFFIIVSGRVEVVKDIDGPAPEVLANFSRGDFFGEIATFKHLPRSASVRALEDTQCLVIWRADFEGFISHFPEAAAKWNPWPANAWQGNRTAPWNVITSL
jgi:CRP-like cAMP-binding protein